MRTRFWPTSRTIIDVHPIDELRAAGLTPVQLVDVADGEDYGEVARRLIDGD